MRMTRPSSPAPGSLKKHVGFWLRFVSNHVSHAFARKLLKSGVTVAEWVILREMFGEAETSPGLVAGRIGMTRGAITKLADRLIAKSLMVRKADPADLHPKERVVLRTPEDRALILQLLALPDAMSAAEDKRAPNILCDYAFNLAQTFSRFYATHHILSETDAALRGTWLGLCGLSLATMTKVLDLLGIEVPPRM